MVLKHQVVKEIDNYPTEIDKNDALAISVCVQFV